MPTLDTGEHVPATYLAREASCLGDMFRRRAERSADIAAIYQKADGRWQGITWAEFFDAASRVAGELDRMGVSPGDRVAILGPTRAPWCIYDMDGESVEWKRR